MKIGFMELVVIFIVALIVLGPDQLPYYAKKLGKALVQFKAFTSEATKDLRENIVEPLKEAERPLKEALSPLDELNCEVKETVNEFRQSMKAPNMPSKQAASETPQQDSSDESMSA